MVCNSKLFCCFLLLCFVSNSYTRTVIFGSEDKHQYPHYLNDSPSFNQKKPGLSVDVLKSVAEKLGFEIKFIRMPWKRCLKGLENGTLDGIFNASYKKDRRQLGRYPENKDGIIDTSRRLATTSYVIYYQNPKNLNWDGKTLATSENIIGATLGYSVVSDLKKIGIQVDEGKDYRLNLDKILLGRIPASVELETATDNYLRQNQSKYIKLKKHKIPFKIKPYYLMLSYQFVRKDPELAEKIWDEIKKLRESPEYQELRKAYNLSN